MKKIILPLIFSLISFNLFSQDNKEIDSSYINYFKNTREVPYLHLNKTSFFKGEEIWFKAYVLNLNTNKLDKNTNNLHCYLFNKNGTLKDQKLIHIKNGLAFESFKIDSTYNDKYYYIKASTNYMKNFREDQSFQQKITIVNNKHKRYSIKERSIDFQLLPEGGNLITDTNNSLGIILKNANNKGVKIKKGEIIENNKTISSFSTNKFGFAKVKVLIKSNHKYQTKILLQDGTEIIKEFPLIKQKGINLHINNPNTNITEFVFSTNQYTIPSIANKKFYFLIHNTRHYLKREIFFKKGAKNISYIIRNNKLKAGTNIITLFNAKNEPIAERVFFNYKKSLFSRVNLDFKTQKDSIILTLKKIKKDSINYYLSTSILPTVTKSYKPQNTIYSKFLLTPYVKGSIQNSNYYFENTNRRKLYDLDLLLLTQGWSKYNWSNIFNSPVNKIYKHEKGININGVFNNSITAKKRSQIFLLSEDNHLIKNKIINNNKFEINNLHLKNNSKLSFSVLKKNKKLRRKNFYLRFSPLKNKNETLLIKNKKHFIKDNTPPSLFKNFIKHNEVILNEVVIKSKNKFKNEPIIFGNTKSFKVSELALKKTQILNFIKFNGFKVIRTNHNVSITNTRGSNSIYATPKTKVYLDGFLIHSSIINNLDFIEYSTLSDFDEIFISKTLNGEIHLFSKRDFSPKKRNLFSHHIVPYGFSSGKKYYQPKYASTQNKLFKNYGAIYWEPNGVIKKGNSEISIKLNSQNQKEITVFIEGITNTGSLISMKKTLLLE